MKALPIPNGGIRIELEDADDWKLLSRMLLDAHDEDYDLVADVSGGISDEQVAGDWNEFVVPDLRDQFDDAIRRVATSLEKAFEAHQGGAGRVVIPRDAAHDWYGVLNRARLALEARYRFGAAKGAAHADPEKHAARLRDRLYCALQSLLLDHAFE